MSNSATRRFQPWEAGVDFVATGRQLRKFRLLNHFTQERLSEVICEECDYSASKNAISTWETGKKLPSLHHAVFLSELYGCRIDQLVISYRRSRESADEDQLVPLLFRISDQTNVRIYVHSSFLLHRWLDDFGAKKAIMKVQIRKGAQKCRFLTKFVFWRKLSTC